MVKSLYYRFIMQYEYLFQKCCVAFNFFLNGSLTIFAILPSDGYRGMRHKAVHMVMDVKLYIMELDFNI